MPGYQVVQTAHAIADFAHEFPSVFSDWKSQSNSIISLSVSNEEELNKLFTKFENLGVPVVMFKEPDINDEATSLCMYGTPDVRKKLMHLPLALKGGRKA